MTLHCLYAPPNSPVALRLLDTLAPGDAVLLLSVAVIFADSAHPDLDAWRREGIELFALEEDLQALGIAEVDSRVTPIDYAQWLDLAGRQANQQNWS